MKNVFFLTLLAGVFVLGSCKSTKPVSGSGGSGNAELVETYWRLVELNGKAIGPTPADKREIHITLRKDGNRMEGFAGCNGVGGTYDLKDGNRLSFKNVIGTLMYCADMETETAFTKMLTTIDNYSLSGKQLTLNKARMAPLARFEAVERKK